MKGANSEWRVEISHSLTRRFDPESRMFAGFLATFLDLGLPPAKVPPTRRGIFSRCLFLRVSLRVHSRIAQKLKIHND